MFVWKWLRLPSSSLNLQEENKLLRKIQILKEIQISRN